MAPFVWTPARRRASTAKSAAAMPAFMSQVPRPQIFPSETSAPKGSFVHPRPAGTTSKWPFRWSVFPGPPPSLRPITFTRGCFAVCSGMPSAAMYSAVKPLPCSHFPMQRAPSS